MKKSIIILTMVGVVSLMVVLVVVVRGRNEAKVDNAADTSNAVESELDTDIIWEEITADGVDEELLLQNIDQDLLEQIAYELQTLVQEAAEEERHDPEIVIREGWTRVWKYERYKKVLSMGKPAMKPLYLIIYKSPYAGEYEYLCANILYELSGFDFEWTNSKEFLEKFNQAIIEQKGEDAMKNITSINVVIDNKNYVASLETNATAQAFARALPQEFGMKELNGNEKYFYFDFSFPVNPSVPQQINAGDIMFYDDNCLVIFYKSFTTSYSYTKIGHVDVLPDLGDDNIVVRFEY